MTGRTMPWRIGTHLAVLAVASLLVAGGCRKESEPAAGGKTPEKKSPATTARVIVLKVAGMQRGEGGKT